MNLLGRNLLMSSFLATLCLFNEPFYNKVVVKKKKRYLWSYSQVRFIGEAEVKRGKKENNWNKVNYFAILLSGIHISSIVNAMLFLTGINIILERIELIWAHFQR